MPHSSVERITEYLVLPQEPPYIIESNRPPAYWPSGSSPSSQDGFISVENLVIKYAPELPAVLRGVSFKIKAQERIGLVGRTGSGEILYGILSAVSHFFQENRRWPPPSSVSLTLTVDESSSMVSILLRSDCSIFAPE